MNEDSKIWLVLLGILIVFTGIIFYARHVTIERGETETEVVSRYTNYPYGVKMSFPHGWLPARGYDYDRYEGQDGFFGIMAGGTGDMSLDEFARIEAEHRLMPYGSSPDIQALSVDGQPARLILPSADQGPSMHGQAALIIEYPEPREVSGEEYKYFILIADKENIHYIASSLTFIRDDE